jgi:hypothetical protein
MCVESVEIVIKSKGWKFNPSGARWQSEAQNPVERSVPRAV